MIRGVVAALAAVAMGCATAKGSGSAPTAAPPEPAAGRAAEPAAPAAPPSPGEAGRDGAAPGAAEEPAGDDAAIESRVEAESEEVREVQDAEARERDVSVPEREATPNEGLAALPEIGHDLARLRAEFDIPIDVNEAVVRSVRFFLGEEMRPHFARWLARLAGQGAQLRAILRRAGVPEDTVFLALVESGLANRATSRARAVGAWQFIEETGRRSGLRRDFWVDERRDPEKAAAAAARLLAQLHRATSDWRLAWAAYNAGPNRIARALQAGHAGFWEMARADGVLPAETRAYVPRIMAAAIIAKHAEEFGFRRGDLVPERWTPHVAVAIPPRTDLGVLARAAGVPVDVLIDLNPELRRTSTPPRTYRLRIPRSRAAAFATAWKRIARAPGPAATRCRRGAAPVGAHAVCVRPGDSLWSIARAHGATVRELARWNRISDPARYVLRAGTVLLVREGGGDRQAVSRRD